MDGKTVPMIFRWERGVINRFMYSIMMLSPRLADGATPGLLRLEPEGPVQLLRRRRDRPLPGRRADGDMRHLDGCRWATPSSTRPATRTNTHYNLQLGGETAIMVKDRLRVGVRGAGVHVGVGGSGGAIEQYVYGQNHPGLIDGGVPKNSYADMVTQTIDVGDCELLERWADFKVIADSASMCGRGRTGR